MLGFSDLSSVLLRKERTKVVERNTERLRDMMAKANLEEPEESSLIQEMAEATDDIVNTMRERSLYLLQSIYSHRDGRASSSQLEWC